MYCVHDLYCTVVPPFVSPTSYLLTVLVYVYGPTCATIGTAPVVCTRSALVQLKAYMVKVVLVCTYVDLAMAAASSTSAAVTCGGDGSEAFENIRQE